MSEPTPDQHPIHRYMDKVAEAERLQQWIDVADDWLGEEWLEEEIHHLRTASQLIEDRISNLETMLSNIRNRKERLADLNNEIAAESPI